MKLRSRMGSPENQPSKKGFCNICNQFSELTWDNVPPKGSIDLKPVEMKYFHSNLKEVAEAANAPVQFHYTDERLKNEFNKTRFSQNGIKFRSICTRCNNALLGGRYDPELSRVSTAVGNLVRAHFQVGLTLPRQMRIPVQTHSVMRGIIGHLLSRTWVSGPDKTSSWV